MKPATFFNWGIVRDSSWVCSISAVAIPWLTCGRLCYHWRGSVGRMMTWLTAPAFWRRSGSRVLAVLVVSCTARALDRPHGSSARRSIQETTYLLLRESCSLSCTPPLSLSREPSLFFNTIHTHSPIQQRVDPCLSPHPVSPMNPPVSSNSKISFTNFTTSYTASSRVSTLYNRSSSCCFTAGTRFQLLGVEQSCYCSSQFTSPQ